MRPKKDLLLHFDRELSDRVKARTKARAKTDEERGIKRKKRESRDLALNKLRDFNQGSQIKTEQKTL